MKPLLLCAFALLGACTMTHPVKREATMMTPRQIADMGLVCKRIQPIGTNISHTICASELSWAAYEKRTIEVSEDLFAKVRELR